MENTRRLLEHLDSLRGGVSVRVTAAMGVYISNFPDETLSDVLDLALAENGMKTVREKDQAIAIGMAQAAVRARIRNAR